MKTPCTRKCWNCGNVAEHADNITPDVCCQKCGSQDTRLVKPTWIYSADPQEESRMMAIRDRPADRVRLMADQRASRGRGREIMPFHGTEIHWIVEEDRFSDTIPVLSPNEYWVMIRNLAIQLRRTYQ